MPGCGPVVRAVFHGAMRLDRFFANGHDSERGSVMAYLSIQSGAASRVGQASLDFSEPISEESVAD